MAQKKTRNHRPESFEESTFVPAFILTCFFLSGLTGLIYEILWTRLLVKIIGSAPFAVSIVLTVFMGGLGIGSYLAGRTIDRIRDPRSLVKLYGILELVVGIYGLMLPLLLALFKPLYTLIYNRFFGHFIVYNLLTFAGCALLLILPVICMGATLPVLSRFYVTRISHVGSHLGRLYGINTIGSAVGSLLCGFWIIGALGMNGALVVAVLINALIGLSCLLVGRTMGTGVKDTGESAIETARTPLQISGSDRLYRAGALTIFAVSGFCAMTYEVIWIRLLELIVGPTTYSFTIVLVIFIAGLALGSLFFGWLADRTRRTFTLLLFTQIIAALAALRVSHGLGNSQIFFAKLILHFSDNFTLLIFLKAVLLFIFMFLPTFFLGATFPLVGKIYTRSLSHVGRAIGSAYAVNTIGAVLGSFSAGFILIPLMGKETSLSLVIIVQLVTALLFGILVYHRENRPFERWIPLVLPVVLGIIFAIPYPHWDRRTLSVAKYHRYEEIDVMDVGWLESLFFGTALFSEVHQGNLVYFGDGIGGFTTVLENTDILGAKSYSLFNSGKSDASTDGGDMCTQTLLAHFPLAFHPRPDDVLVLGLASGITAGEVLYYPVKHLDVIDINRQVVRASDFFIPWNNNVLSHPVTELIIQDGRAHMALTDRTYDIVISEPSNPWMAGLASLFTREFFDLVRGRLKENGIYVQWVHSYQMDWENFAMIGRTFARVFPRSLLVSIDPAGLGADYLLVGFKGDTWLDRSTVEQNLVYASQSKNATILDSRIFYSLIVGENLEKLFGDGPINMDNHPILEFSAPKLMHSYDPAIADTIQAREYLTDETKAIITAAASDVDAQINYAAYALSFNKTFENIVDLERATPAQKERFARIVEAYCSENILTDYSFVGDSEIKDRCLSAQIDMVRAHLSDAPDTTMIYYRLGNLYNERNMLVEAYTYYTKTLELDPDNEKAHYNLGRIFTSQGRYGEAIKHYEEALRINPYYAMAYNNLGNIHTQRGELDRAVSNFREAVRIDPDFALGYQNLGVVLKRLGKDREGEYYLEEALRIKEKSATFTTIRRNR